MYVNIKRDKHTKIKPYYTNITYLFVNMSYIYFTIWMAQVQGPGKLEILVNRVPGWMDHIVPGWMYHRVPG